MQSVQVCIELDPEPSRLYRLPAQGKSSLLYVFGPERTLGARAYCDECQHFEPGTRHDSVRLGIWAEEEWTDVVVNAATFTVRYGGDVGRGVVTLEHPASSP